MPTYAALRSAARTQRTAVPGTRPRSAVRTAGGVEGGLQSDPTAAPRRSVAAPSPRTAAALGKGRGRGAASPRSPRPRHPPPALGWGGGGVVTAGLRSAAARGDFYFLFLCLFPLFFPVLRSAARTARGPRRTKAAHGPAGRRTDGRTERSRGATGWGAETAALLRSAPLRHCSPGAPHRAAPPAASGRDPPPRSTPPPHKRPPPPHAQRPPPFFPYRAQRAEGRLAEERGLRLRRPRRIEEAAGGEWEGAEGAGLLQGARAAPPGAALHGPAALGLRLRLTARSAAARPLLAAAETPPLTGPPRRRVPLAGKASAALTSTRRHGRGMWKTQHRDPPSPPPSAPINLSAARGLTGARGGAGGGSGGGLHWLTCPGGAAAHWRELSGGEGGASGAGPAAAARGGAGLGLCLAERRQGRWASSCTVLGPGRAPQQLSVKRRFPWLSEGRVS